MTYVLWLGLALCLLVAAFVGISAYAAKHWAATTLTRMQELNAARSVTPSPSQTHYNSRELDGLPAPVQRYFRMVLKEGQPIIAAANIQMTGTFNLSTTGAQWKPFTSRQWVVNRRPGFLWDAEILMLPGFNVRVIDSYIGGIGRLHAAIMGMFTMADVSGGGDIARGEFMRFFAEAVWYPTALLPSQGVRWAAVDDRSANATIVDGPLSLTLLFRFNEAGLIDSFRAEARGAVVGKETVFSPWEGDFSNYKTQDGITVPFKGEVAWMRPEGRKPYFVGVVTSLTYEFQP